jgi:iron complex transport system permease protein
MRVTLDLSQLVADGRLSADEAQHLATLAEGGETPAAGVSSPPAKSASPRGRVFANVAMIFGALAVVVGVELLNPSAAIGGALAVAALVAAALLRRRADESWTLLAHALAIGGALGACLAFELRFATLEPSLLFVGVFLAATAVYFRSGVIAAFAPLALGSWLGSGAGYWHASYSISITQPLVTIAVFSAFSAGLFWLLYRVPRYAAVVTVMARVSFLLANFGFWVGSLWGDDLGAGTVAAAVQGSSSPAIPAVAFSIGWLAALLIALAVGLRTRRRFISNSAITFLGIHFYTQVFETFGGNPVVVIFCGLLLVAFAFGLVRFDAWQKRRGTPDDVQSRGPRTSPQGDGIGPN